MTQKTTVSEASDADSDVQLSSSDKQRMTEQIGRHLRGMYNGILNQPVPDRFMDLVNKLDGAKPGPENDR